MRTDHAEILRNGEPGFRCTWLIAGVVGVAEDDVGGRKLAIGREQRKRSERKDRRLVSIDTGSDVDCLLRVVPGRVGCGNHRPVDVPLAAVGDRIGGSRPISLGDGRQR